VFGIAAPEPAASPLADADTRKSGSPGYVDGLPVCAGLVTNATDADGKATMVMRVLRQGLTVPGMALPSGLCRVCAMGAAADKWGCDVAETGTQGFEDPERTAVRFNQDISVGCRLKLTQPQLADMCTAQEVHPLLRYPRDLRIAIWGDSDPGIAAEWLPDGDVQEQLADTATNPAATQAWDPRGNCSNMVQSMHLQILTARLGHVANPQEKIIGARVTYGNAVWLAPQEQEAAYYSISASVSFLHLPDGASIEAMPPVPSILPILPDDIFYPFATGAGARTRAPAAGAVWLRALVASIIGFLCARC